MYRGRNVYNSKEDAVVRVRLPALQMKEHCAMAGIRFMWAPETCCQIRPGARSLGDVFKMFKMIYNSRCDGSYTVAQGGITGQCTGFTARSLSSGAVALRHANASRKTWRYGQSSQREETFLAGTCRGFA